MLEMNDAGVKNRWIEREEELYQISATGHGTVEDEG